MLCSVAHKLISVHSEQEMTESESNVLDLIGEYQQYAQADMDDEELLEVEGDFYADEVSS